MEHRMRRGWAMAVPLRRMVSLLRENGLLKRGGSLIMFRVNIAGFVRAHRKIGSSALLACLLLTSSFVANASSLTVDDVATIISRAVGEASARGMPATIAVVDRVGNVLGVFQMNGVVTDPVTGIRGPVTITSQRQPRVETGLENIDIIPSTLAAIAKAITGAYLSSKGNAFTTRTANQIVQENFNPGEFGQPGGPLFGVQFSSLPCSDLNTRFKRFATTGELSMLGPKRSPLGLSADPGGLPLYKNGVPVGAIGAIADGIYGLDSNIVDRDSSVDELIAIAGTFGFSAPEDRKASRITVDGRPLRFTDQDFGSLAANPLNAPPFASINGSLGAVVAVRGYTEANLENGAVFGQPSSGIRSDRGEFFPGQKAFVLVNRQDINRFPPRAGSNLSQAEVQTILSSALRVAENTRAQIRRPLNAAARVTISVVDTDGSILGIARSPDAPVFGIDVSLQKARTAAFFSSAVAATNLAAATDAVYFGAFEGPASFFPVSNYLSAAQVFFGDPNVLNGQIAFTDRAAGNLARPFFPDGLGGRSNGPFSKPFPEWSPFSTGLQLDLVVNAVLAHVGFVVGLALVDTGKDCTDVSQAALELLQNLKNIPPEAQISEGQPIPQIRDGIQIFPGSVPIYRGDTLIGGVGVSGDGVDQDDLVAFLGLHNAATALGTINHAPPFMRADTLTPLGVRLRYVQCPIAPFRNNNDQNVCQGK